MVNSKVVAEIVAKVIRYPANGEIIAEIAAETRFMENSEVVAEI
jgi:hypothetical protein